MRTVLIHYHLFKNAGTTLDAILARTYPGPSHGHIEGPEPWSTVSPERLLDYASANPAIGLISSHQAHLPVPESAYIRFLPILFLRHPVDRFASVYEYERRQSANTLSPSAIVARDSDLKTFAQWAIGRDATAVCRTFQVVRLAASQSDMRFARATHEDYFTALARLSQLPFFGIVESFEHSMIGLQRMLEPYIGKIDLHYTIENASPGRLATLPERLDRIKMELGAGLYRDLLEINALDMLLYIEATRLFNAKHSE